MPRPDVRRELQYYEPNDALNGLFSKKIWLVLGAGAVRKGSLSHSLFTRLIAPTEMLEQLLVTVS